MEKSVFYGVFEILAIGKIDRAGQGNGAGEHIAVQFGSADIRVALESFLS